MKPDEQRWAVAYDFVESFGDAKAIGSASTEARTDRAGGVSRACIFQHPPLDAGAPAARLEFPAVPLPALNPGESLRLRLYGGMSDRIAVGDTPAFDGCEFAVLVNGREMLRRGWDKQEWFEWAADLSEDAGKTVAVTFTMGARANSQADWALWGDPRIEIVGRPWRPREGPRAPSLRMAALERTVPIVRHPRDVWRVGGNTVVAVVDPYLDLPTQVRMCAWQTGRPSVPLAPTIVAGEGPDPANHTLIRVLGPFGIADLQFLAYPPRVHGGVAVELARTSRGALRIVSAPLTDASMREVRSFGLDGVPVTSFEPSRSIRAPFAIAAGNFLRDKAGEEIAVAGGGVCALHDVSGRLLRSFRLPALTEGSVSLARAPGDRADGLLVYRKGARLAHLLRFDGSAPAVVALGNVEGADRVEGVHPSAFGGRFYAVGPHPSRSTVAVLRDSGSPRQLDIGAYENRFWFQWYRPTTQGRYVRASDFAHLRTDHATEAGRRPETAAAPRSWSAEAMRKRFGTTGGFAGYLTDRPKLWEPCFTHRQPKGVFQQWLDSREAATGMPIYSMLTRNGKVVEYGEFGNLDFYASTYAFGLPAIDNLYILPLRGFLRQLVVPFRQRPEHCAGLEPNHEHEIAVEADASMGDYNLTMISGFYGYLRRIYGGTPGEINRAMGTSFTEYFDAPRNWDRGPWDRYDLANPYYRAWIEYNRYVVTRRVAETFREALAAGFPPEIVKCHQIPDTYAVGNLQAFSDVTARFTPVDWMLNAGAGYGFTRYGVWYNRPHDALQDAHAAGFDAMSMGEYQALTPDADAAYRQLRFMFDNGCVSAHCMLWPEGHDRGYNDTMHKALERLIAEDPPRPGLTGGVGQIRPYSDGKRRFDIACIGTGPDHTGLLKSLNADGSWEGSIYVVPFHAHVDVKQEPAPTSITLAGRNALSLGPFNDLDSGEQIEVLCRARGTPDVTPQPGPLASAHLRISVTRSGRELPGLTEAVPVQRTWRPLRLILRNQLPVEGIRIELRGVRGRIAVKDIQVIRQSECTPRLSKGRFEGKRHRGAVTFDVARGAR